MAPPIIPPYHALNAIAKNKNRNGNPDEIGTHAIFVIQSAPAEKTTGSTYRDILPIGRIVADLIRMSAILS